MQRGWLRPAIVKPQARQGEATNSEATWLQAQSPMFSLHRDAESKQWMRAEGLQTVANLSIIARNSRTATAALL
jgi:hypothetical protein